MTDTNDNLPPSERWIPSTGPASVQPLPGKEEAMNSAEALIERVMKGLDQADLIGQTARALFMQDNPGVAWEMADGPIQAIYMRRAALAEAGPQVEK